MQHKTAIHWAHPVSESQHHNLKGATMKTFVSVRHAEYNGSSLTATGRRQAQALAGLLAQLLGANWQPVILSSNATCAKETAQYIANTFGGNVVADNALFTDENNVDCPEIAKALSFIEKKAGDAKVVIVVSHCDANAVLLERYARNRLQKRIAACDRGYAGGHILDCTTGKLRHVKGAA